MQCRVQKAYLQYNYPLSSVAFDPSPQTFTRTATNVGSALSLYYVWVVPPQGFDNRVMAVVITFMETKLTTTFSMTCTRTGDNTWMQETY